jgi:hypothetical protein
MKFRGHYFMKNGLLEDVGVSLRMTAAAALVTVSLAGSAPAQVVEQKPWQDIVYGETLAAFLTTSDDSLDDGSLYKSFVFSGEVGDSVTMEVSSIDFDAFLLFADSVGELLSSDDNGGGKCNSRMTFVLPQSGPYMVLATTKRPRSFGEFQVSVARGFVGQPGADRCSGFFDMKGTIAVGDSVMGTLGPPDGQWSQSYFQVWAIAVPAGDTATVDLRSGDFDALLLLYQGFSTAIDSDDDGGGACHARLHVVGSGHPMRVVMRSGKAQETGEYVLRVVPGALPKVPESQCAP